MSYGFGVGGEAIGQFGEGIRAARMDKMERENQHLDRMYQRYKIGEEQTNRAQAKVDWKYRTNADAAARGVPSPFDPNDRTAEDNLDLAQRSQDSIVNDMSKLLGGGGKTMPKTKTQKVLKFFQLYDEFQNPKGGATPNQPGGPAAPAKTSGGLTIPAAPGAATPTTAAPQAASLAGGQPSKTSGLENAPVPQVGSLPLQALPRAEDTSPPGLAFPGKKSAVDFGIPRDNAHADLNVIQPAPPGTSPDLIRADGTLKGPGFLGTLPHPGGGHSTELSIGVNINGKEMEIPSLVPGLTPQEIQTVLNEQDPKKWPSSIVNKAVTHAQQRIAQGKSVFADATDKAAPGQPGVAEQTAPYRIGVTPPATQAPTAAGVPAAPGTPAVPTPSAPTGPTAQGYQWPTNVGQSAERISKIASGGLPMSRVPISPSTMKQVEASQQNEISRHAGTLIEGLSGYVQHVRSTPGHEDDTLEVAYRDPAFNKAISALEQMQAKKLIPAGTVDNFLKLHFQDYRAPGTTPTPEQTAKNKHFANIGQPGGPKDIFEAERQLAEARRFPSTDEKWNQEVSPILRKPDAERTQPEKNTIRAWKEYLQAKPSATGTGIQLMAGENPEGGAPGVFRVPKAGGEATTVSGIQPPSKPVTIAEFQETKTIPGHYITDPNTGKKVDYQGPTKATVRSAAKMIEGYEGSPFRVTLQHLKSWANDPELWKDNPEERQILLNYIKRQNPFNRKTSEPAAGAGEAETVPEEETENFEEGPTEQYQFPTIKGR